MASPPAGTGPQEFELTNPPSDGITNVTFCPGTSLLLVSSWDAVCEYFKESSVLANICK